MHCRKHEKDWMAGAGDVWGPRFVGRSHHQRHQTWQSTRPGKKVHVVVKSTAEDFYLKVTDQGPGFDPHKVPDCTAPENLELGSGRGLLMMRHYMDEVIYNHLGNQLELKKRLPKNDT